MKKSDLFQKIVAFVIICFFFTAMNAFCKDAPQSNVKKDSYDYTGTVLRVGEGEIVVDDHILYISKSVVYHREGGGKGLVSKKINPGTRIGFKLDEKKEISDIWILKNKK